MAQRNILGSDEEDLHLHGIVMKPNRKGLLRLTNLPTDILRSILSRLPLKEAVRTSILSEHWKHVWRCHSNLEFSLRSMLPDPRINGPNDVRPWKQVFIERVDAVLQQHCGAGVDHIQFQAPCDDEHGDRIEGWVRFAVASKAKQLILNFSATYHIQHPYKFDLRLLDDSKSLHLQSIKLCSVSLKVPVDFKGFRNLKRIFLADTNITDGDLQHLVSNCSSILEFLGIAGCGMITRLRISHLSKKLKHLQVYDCRSLQAMELNFGLVKLEYRGPSIILLSPPGTLLLADICIKLQGICTNALEYIFTKLCNNAPRLEILTLRCREGKMATLPGKLHEFVHLKHLILDLTFGFGTRTTDILQFACLLVAAPFLEKLEFHMWLKCQHERYSVDKGHLRSLPSQPHSHLRSIDITGFYGEKDQLELALHILRDSVVLESMKIDPEPAAAPAGLTRLAHTEAPHFVDGYEVAREFLRSRDRRDVVHVVKPLACLKPLMLGASRRIDAAERAAFLAALRRRNAG